jgi:endoglucanase
MSTSGTLRTGLGATAIVFMCAAAACGDDAGNAGGGGSSGGGSSGASGASSSGGSSSGGSSSGGSSGTSSGDGGSSSGGDGGGGTGLHVVMGTGGANGHIVDGAGNAVRLRGVDRAGTEWSCLYGTFSSGANDQAAIDVIKGWKVNAVRVPLNEDCWLGINGVPAAFSGKTYQDALRAYVDLLEKNGLYVILDLHWAAPGAVQANGQLGMADADHAPTFWSQLAAAYAKDNASVIFDLFNEPFITDWDCWLKGGSCSKDYKGAAYTATGMAALLKAVRTAGADNVVILGGLGYSSDFSQWVAKVNSIPTLAAPLDGLTTKNLAISWHTYSDQSVQTLCPTQYNNYSPTAVCASGADTAKNYGITAALTSGYPVVVGEIGIGVDSNTLGGYSAAQAQQLATWLEGMLTWLDQQEVGYFAWNWNTVARPVLLTAFDGTPSPYFGVTYKAHLAK